MNASFGRRSRRRPAPWIAPLLAVLALGAGAASAHAAEFLSPMAVSPTSSTTSWYEGADVAMDGAGTTTVAFYYYDGSNAEVQYVTRAPGGSFSAPTRLSTPGRYSYNPRVVANSAGDVLITWQENNGSHYIVRATFKPAGGSFGAPVDVSGAGQNAYEPAAALAADGTGLVAWRRSNGSHFIVQAATKPAGTGFFGSVSDLSATGQSASAVDAAMNDQGDATVVWSRSDGTTNRIQAATKPASGGFGATQTLTPSLTGNAFGTKVAMTSNRRATAVWYRYSGSGYSGNAAIQSAETDANGTFGTVQDVTNAASTNSFQPSVDVDDSNNAVASWYAYNGSTYVVYGASRTPGGFFGVAQPMSGPGSSAFSPQVKLDPAGNTIGAFGASSGGGVSPIQISRRPFGGSFGGPQTVSGGDNSYSPRLAFDGQGNGVIVYTTYITNQPPCCTYQYTIKAVAYDAAGPDLRDVNVPGSGTTGSPVGMSVNPVDRWTGTTTTWNFGDGTSADGASVSHTYGTPGPYTVTVTSRDGAGNESSTTRVINVASPPPPPPPPPPPAQATRIVVTMTYAFSKSTAKFTRFTLLKVKGVPRGSTLKVSCKAPKRKKCPAKSFTKKNARGTVSLKKWQKKKLAAGTKLTVTVTKSGNFIGAVKTLTVRKKARPKFSDRCLQPGAKKPTRC